MRILPCLPARHHLALAFLLLPGTLPSASAQPPTDGVVFIRIIGDVQLAKGPDSRIWQDTLSLTDTEIGSVSGCKKSSSSDVLTNYHVIHGGRRKAWINEVPVDLVATVKRVEVILPPVPGGDEVEPVHAMEATVVAFDAELDLAVLYVSGAELPYLRLGDSAALRLGDPVAVVGFPLGRGVELEGSPEPMVPSASVSSGTVSGLRGGAAFGSTWPVRYIQTTAAINPGNSGGPMLDDDGNVVGITVGRAEPAQSVGFAIPIELARRFLEMRGLDSALPAQALDLGSFYEAPAKGLRLRVPIGFEDASRRRVHVDSDASLGAMTLRIDRVVSPWAAPEIEQALLGAGGFEAEAMVTLRRGAHLFRGPPGSIVGMAAESSADGTLRMLYVIQRIGREWIVARYVGSADAVAFNRSTLQASLASLEASPLLQQRGAGRIRPVLVPAGPGLLGWKPEGWIVEDDAPLTCRSLGRAEALWSASPEQDYTLSFKLARWRDVSAEAAAACVAGRDSTEGARYRRQFDILGVTFSVDGVFLPLGKGDVVQLEMLTPLGSRPAYESLYGAWIARHTAGAEIR